MIRVCKRVNQIDYTKPKTIACSYFFGKSELQTLKKVFKKLRIGISVNSERFNLNYLKSVVNLVNVTPVRILPHLGSTDRRSKTCRCHKPLRFPAATARRGRWPNGRARSSDRLEPDAAQDRSRRDCSGGNARCCECGDRNLHCAAG